MLSAKMHLETACGQTQRFSKKQEKCPQKTERMLVSTTEPTDAANLGDNQVHESSLNTKARLEEAARRSFAKRAQSASGSVITGLSSIFRAIGAIGQPEAFLPVEAFQETLEEMLKEICHRTESSRRAAKSPFVSTREVVTGASGMISVMAKEICTHLAQRTANESKGIDYRSFEDWVIPTRSVAKLNTIVKYRFERDTAFGRHAAELFEKISANKRGEGGKHTTTDLRVDLRQLQEGMSALGVHLTQTETRMLMEAVGCDFGRLNNDGCENSLLSFDMFSSMLSMSQVHTKAGESLKTSSAERPWLEPVADNLSPDSLSQVAWSGFPLKVHRKAVVTKGGESVHSGTGSSSPVACVEASERVAPDVHGVPVSSTCTDMREERMENVNGKSLGGRGNSSPYGPGEAFSTSPPHADEGLTELQPELTERLELHNGSGATNMTRTNDGDILQKKRNSPVLRHNQDVPVRGTGRALPGTGTRSDVQSDARIHATIAPRRTLSGFSRGRCVSAAGIRREKCGIASCGYAGNGKSRSVRFLQHQSRGMSSRPQEASRNSDSSRQGDLSRAKGVETAERPSLVDHGDADYCCNGSAEIIGRLRARVTELELTEQLLRCELEGAHADLADHRKRAELETEVEAKRSKDREGALQARMFTRLRALEAELASMSRRMAEHKRIAAAEAAAREKSSAEYLRRRLKETEVATEAKLARLAAKRTSTAIGGPPQGVIHRGMTNSSTRDIGSNRNTRVGRGKEARDEGNHSGRPSRGRAGVSIAKDIRADRLQEELDSCRKKLITVTDEVSRLRLRAKTVRCERARKSFGGKDTDGAGTGRPSSENGTSLSKSCVCDASSKNCAREAAVVILEGKQQRARERRLERRLAESEDSRVGVEAEVCRLRAFIDEMKVLRSRYTVVGAAE